MDILEYLEEKGHWVKPAGSSDIHTFCPFHGEDEESPGRLHICVDEDDINWGCWICFVCDERGNFNKLRAHFGDSPIEFGEIQDSHYDILECATQYYADRLLENPEAYRYLTDERGLSEAQIISSRLGWADGGLVKHLLEKGHDIEIAKNTGIVNTHFSDDYFHNRITIPYLRYGRPIQIRGKEIGGKCLGPSGHPVHLYGTDSIIGEQTVHLVEGEFDTLTLQQLDFPTVGVPGVQTWKDDWDDFLVDAKRIFIMFDADAAGKRGAEKMAQRFGPRARIVELPKKGIDVNDYFVKHGKLREDFDYLFSKAKGGLLASPKEALEAWVDIEGIGADAGLRFNIGPLDRVMDYGWLPSQILTMIARSGEGKTMWAVNLFHRMRMVNPDIKILFASLEQTRNEWFERAHRLHAFYEPGVTVMDTVEFWQDNLLILDKNRITEEELVDSIDQFAYESGRSPDLVCVDYVGYYSRSFPGDERQKTIAAMLGLKAIAKDHGCRILALHQANRTGILGHEVTMDMAQESAAVEQTSDIMIGQWNPDSRIGIEPHEREGQIYQKLLKSRNGGTGLLFRYQASPLTMAMVPLDDPLYKRALSEKAWYEAGDTWKEAIERHKSGSQALSPLSSLSARPIEDRPLDGLAVASEPDGTNSVKVLTEAELRVKVIKERMALASEPENETEIEDLDEQD